MPRRHLCLLVSLGIFLAGGPGFFAQEKRKPITTLPGKAGDLLRKWEKEGTAAGNDGDFYDNRDCGHSDLDTAPFPQLKRIVYSPEEIKLRKHWAGQSTILPHVVFGNSSTSAPPLAGGSNPRMYYTQARGLSFLYDQYTKNNLYIYPEHRDHDPGHNGPDEGFGDLYPTNTPYLIISQGSSGSDQPFMRALPLTLAAFRPEVKKKLVETGLLMPTIQMLLRTTNKNLKDPKEYLTGKGQPSVFEGSWLDDTAMVEAAHAIQEGSIPPMVQLKVIEEEEPVRGKDFFEVRGTEKLADTPAVIARIFRGAKQTRRMVVSAEDSYDVNKKPLAFTWVVLRGDAERIKITPLNKEQSKAEVVVPWPERRPIAPGASLESNRIDIGVFVHNGVHYSAPGFVTFYSLDHEARTYDAKGRIVEIGYGMGETKPIVRDWAKFCMSAGAEKLAPLLNISDAEREMLRTAAPEIEKKQAAIDEARRVLNAFDKKLQEVNSSLAKLSLKIKELEKKLAEHQDPEVKSKLEEDKKVHADQSRTKDEMVKERQAAEKTLQAGEKAMADFLDQPREAVKQSLRDWTRRRLESFVNDPTILMQHSEAWKEIHAKAPLNRGKAVEVAYARVFDMGIAKENADKSNSDALRQTKDLTAFGKMLIGRFHAAALEHLAFPDAVTFATPTNVTDQRLSAPRFWRDAYRYGDKGHYLGWTRFDGVRRSDFNPDGHLVVESDQLGRCVKARAVRYLQDPPPKIGLNKGPLRWEAEQTVILYEYAGPDDWQGKVKSP